MALIHGTHGNDTLIGTSGDDFLMGGPGDDLLQGDAGNDTLNSGLGNDTMDGGIGSDTLILHPSGDVDFSTVDMIAGTIEGVHLSTGIHFTKHFSNIENIHGSGASLLIGDDLANNIFWISGNDTILGGGGDDTIRLTGGTVNGGEGNDRILNPSYQSGIIVSFEDGAAVTVDLGTERINRTHWVGHATGQGSDYLLNVRSVIGSSFDDSIEGNGDGNALNGADGDDSLVGGGGGDKLTGGNGNDTLQGGSGKDALIGGADADVLKGGLDADTFVFQGITNSGLTTATRDRIFDFSQAEGDKLDLTALHLTAFMGDGHFFGHGEGSARYVLQDTATYDRTMLYVDANGDGHTDMSIQFSNALIDFTEGDILL